MRRGWTFVQVVPGVYVELSGLVAVMRDETMIGRSKIVVGPIVAVVDEAAPDLVARLALGSAEAAGYDPAREACEDAEYAARRRLDDDERALFMDGLAGGIEEADPTKAAALRALAQRRRGLSGSTDAGEVTPC